jgi:hypothetical protein
VPPLTARIKPSPAPPSRPVLDDERPRRLDKTEECPLGSDPLDERRATGEGSAFDDGRRPLIYPSSALVDGYEGLSPLQERVMLAWPRPIATLKAFSGPGAAPSQVAVDCLTGNGGMPAEGNAVMAWMADNESACRLPVLPNPPDDNTTPRTRLTVRRCPERDVR